MKILLVTNYQPPHMGGIEFAARSLKTCWREGGHDVTWMTTDLPAGGAESTPDNVRIPAWNFLEERFQVNSPLLSPIVRSKVFDEVKRADVVNIHSLAPGLSNVALRAAWRARKPVVLTQHVAVIPLRSQLLSSFQRHFILAMARRVVKRGGLLTFVGRAVREWFETEASLDPARLFMTPAGIDHDTYRFVADAEREQFRAKWISQPEKLHILFVGRFYDKKGIPLIRELAVTCPHFNFTLVGSGPINPAEWNLPNIRIVGFVSNEELRELYGSHDLFLMPSYGEGWPAVVPQAMACGLPCMISEECFSGFNRDRERFMVVRRDANAIAEQLKKLAESPTAFLTDRESASGYAMREWDWRRTAEIYTDLFEQVIRERSQGSR